MKQFFIFFLLCLAGSLYGQVATECSANAGPDQSICHGNPVTLTAPASLDYNNPPNIQWTYIPGPPPGIPANQIVITPSNGLTANVTYTGPGGPNLPIGTYTFRFCVDCKDINNNHINDRPCDEVTIFVKDDPTEPVITEPDGVQDGFVLECSTANLGINLPGAGEFVSASVFPVDGLVDLTVNGTSLVVKRKDTNSSEQGECNYKITYYISNGGCTKSKSVQVRFVKPQDPNEDGIIEGTIYACPSCTRTLYLYGDRPGCGGEGRWTLVSGPGDANPFYESPEYGDAGVEVTAPGLYTFQYEVTNIAPCQSTPFTISCLVLDLEGFEMGESHITAICTDVVPAGSFEYTFNDLPNTVFSWGVNPSSADVTIVPNATGNAATININSPFDLSSGPLIINVYATRYYIDKDCEGDETPHVLDLPSSDPKVVDEFIKKLKEEGACIYSCTDYATIRWYGSPKIKLVKKDVNFLCSDGQESIILNQFYSIANLYGYSDITVLSQPAGSNLPNTVTGSDLLTLNGFGDYVFRINAYTTTYNPTITCTDTKILTVRVRGPQPVSAGTDQIKCFNETIRLNGNDAYGGSISGTWKQVNCGVLPCSVTFADAHDPNTQIFLNGITINDLPLDLFFEWSYDSQDPSCDLKDVTKVTVTDCRVPCENLGLHVNAICTDGKMILTAVDNAGNEIDESIYTVAWTGSTPDFPILHQNPVTITDPGAVVSYSVKISLITGEVETCINIASGTYQCVPEESGCGITIKERCDECGNVILVAVDNVTGLPVPPSTYNDEFYWTIYDDGPTDMNKRYVNGQNPITVGHNACYSLRYVHYTYPPGVPHVPGYGTLCRWESTRRCVSVNCFLCEDFPDFFVAGCGDDLDQTLGLTFPANCQSVCSIGGLGSGSGTLGVFRASDNSPVSTADFNIVWENGSTGTYAQGSIQDIDHVKITEKAENGCCFWQDKYVPRCLCHNEPGYVHCEQPIVKHCNSNGTVTYSPQSPQIAWYNISGASGYMLEITFNNTECCSDPSQSGTVMIPWPSSPWPIPSNYHCFTIRVKAMTSDGPCPESEWSQPYTYCQATNDCFPVIIVCGCCHERSGEEAALPTTIVDEETILAMLKSSTAPGYSTLEDALKSVGVQTGAMEPFVSVFPNPAQTALTVRFKKNTKETTGFTFEMFDTFGRRTLSRPMSGNGEQTLDISGFAAGVYTWRLVGNADGKVMENGKVVVIP